MGAIKRWFDRRARRLDIEILWKICCEQARDEDRAKAAFMVHVTMDPAWSEYFSEAELYEIVDKLTCEPQRSNGAVRACARAPAA